jgi:hypothetical protein
VDRVSQFNQDPGRDEEMIPVHLAKEPESFKNKVSQPGLRAISEMVGKEPVFPRQGGRPETAPDLCGFT